MKREAEHYGAFVAVHGAECARKQAVEMRVPHGDTTRYSFLESFFAMSYISEDTSMIQAGFVLTIVGRAHLRFLFIEGAIKMRDSFAIIL